MSNFYKKTVRKILIRIYHTIIGILRNIQNIPYKNAVKKIIKEKDLIAKIEKLNSLANSNEKKVFYIIRRDNASVGLLTYVSIFLGHIAYAVSKGYVPIIDMQNFGSIYQNKEDFKKKNVWEFYFKQPYNFDLSHITKHEKCIYSPLYIQPMSPFINSVLSDEESRFWKILSQNYIKLNDEVNDYFEHEYDELIKGKNVLGLLYRGTDYKSLRPLNHPIQPSIDQFIQQIEKSICEWGDFDFYYIATEEKGAFEFLDKRFPGKIIVNKRVYYDGFKNIKFLAEAKFDRQNDNYLKGLEYLSSICLLAKCDSIVAGLCAGTYAANFIKEGEYTNKFYFNLGVY